MNVIPFVDIMLVLLTIVLTTSTFIATGRIPVNLPQASRDGSEVRPATSIELDAAGAVYLEGAPVTVESLEGRISAFDRSTSFIVRADQDVRLQRFIDVVDVLKRLRFANVAVQTRHRS